MDKNLNDLKIVSLLHALDDQITEPCKIIICGGAAAIVGYGIKRVTGDIDILEPIPKSRSFNDAVKTISESQGLDSKWINDGVKGFVGYLSPDFQKRLVPLKVEFNNLEVFIISKPDFLTMKICAWRESDKPDIEAVGISKEDLKIIKENLAYVAKNSPEKAHKAYLVLSELGLSEAQVLMLENISTLTELIQYYQKQKATEPSIEEIRKWKDDIKSGLSPEFLARSISKVRPDKELSLGMDI